MIKVWTNEERVSAEFNGTVKDLIDEMGYLMKKFANEILKIDEVEFCKTFIVAYEKAAKDEANDETDMY